MVSRYLYEPFTPVKMGMRGCLIFLLLVLTVNTCGAQSSHSECRKKVEEAMVKPIPGKVWIQLMKENEDNGPGFVYSDLNIFRMLNFMAVAGGQKARNAIASHFGYSTGRYCYDTLCTDLTAVTTPLQRNIHMMFSYFYSESFKHLARYKSRQDTAVFCFSGSTQTFFVRDVEKNAKDFINERFKKKTGIERYLKKYLNDKTSFLIANGFKLDKAIFDDVETISYRRLFTDLDGKKKNVVKWSKISTGTYQNKLINITGCPGGVNFYGVGIHNNEYWMLFFQPNFQSNDNISVKTECLNAIFPELRKYINDLKNLRGPEKVGGEDFTLAIPDMSLLTYFDLKPSLISELPALFEKYGITNVYSDPDTLYELNMVAGFSIRDLFRGPVPDIGRINARITTPFVFTLVDSASNVILKSGAYLRGQNF